MRVYLFTMIFTSLLALPAHGAAFCEDENLVIDAEQEWDFTNGFLQDFILPTHRGGNLFNSKSVLHLGAGAGEPELWGIFEFPRRPNETGLAYNIYRLQIQIGSDGEPDRQIIDQDYTAGCTGAGISLWPGARIELRSIKLEPHADGAPRALEPVHLRFWGK